MIKTNSCELRVGIVLEVTPGFSETFFNNTIKGLMNNGISVSLYANKNNGFEICKVKNGFSNQGNYLIRGISFFHVCVNIFCNLLRANRYFKYNKIDGYSSFSNFKSLVINSHILSAKLDWLHFGFAAVAVGRENVARAIGAKMAVSVRGYDLALFPIQRAACYSLLWKRLDKLHVLSEHLLKKSVELGFNHNRIPAVKITPAIDIEAFNYIEKPIIEKNRFQFLTVARLHWIKGLDDTLIALSQLKDFNFEYHIIGDGPEKQRLQFLVHELKLEQQVKFHGVRDKVFVREYMKRADIYIQYSEHEGFCNAVLEAQACGCLCLVGAGSGMDENIQDGITGFSVTVRNPQALVGEIKHVLALNENAKNLIRKNAQKRVSDEFNLEIQALAFYKFYSN